MEQDRDIVANMTRIVEICRIQVKPDKTVHIWQAGKDIFSLTFEAWKSFAIAVEDATFEVTLDDD